MLIDLAARLRPLAQFKDSIGDADVVSWRDNKGRTLLFFTVSATNQKIRFENSLFLLDAGVDVSVVTRRGGWTALHWFMSVQHPKMVDDVSPDVQLFQRLLDAGADINAVSARYGSPLQFFCRVVSATPSEETLRPYYEVFFSAPELDITGPSGFNRSTLDTIREFFALKKRPLLREYVTRFLNERGTAFPED